MAVMAVSDQRTFCSTSHTCPPRLFIRQHQKLERAPDFDDMSSFFFLYVTDNVCVYKDTVHEPLDREMYILEVIFVIFLILGHYFVFRVILLSFLEIFNSIQFYILICCTNSQMVNYRDSTNKTNKNNKEKRKKKKEKSAYNYFSVN
jgi:hypothetical protein